MRLAAPIALIVSGLFLSPALAAPVDFACVANVGSGSDSLLSLREKPSPDAGEVARLPAGSALKITGAAADGGWVNVDVLSGLEQKGQGTSGWVNSKFLQPVRDTAECKIDVATGTKPPPPRPPAPPSPAPAEIAFACVANLGGSGTDFLSLRQSPSAKAGEIVRLPGGTGLAVGGRTDDGNWTKVGVPGGPSGWVGTKYLQPVPDLGSCKVDEANSNPRPPQPAPKPALKPAEIGFACVDYLGASGDNFLSLRQQPSASAVEIARLPAGSALAIDHASGAWLGVHVLNGQPGSGWVNARYLRRVADPKTCKLDVATTKPGDGKPDGTDKPGTDEPPH